MTEPHRPLRYVAVGDSTVEGLEDPGPDGVYVGWADRLARHLADQHGEVLYANLAVRGQTVREVRATQLERAVALRPDVAVVVAGVNDLLRPRLTPETLREDLLATYAALHEAGATVLTFTMPDMARVAPLAVLLRARLRALNEVVYEARDRYGTLVADLATEPSSSDPVLWHDDRLHANTEGHRRVAAALAETLGIDAGDWREPPVPRPTPSLVGVAAREAFWLAGHVLPWAWGHYRGRGDEPRVCKRPELLPVD